jgi:hypothetical protein
MFRQDGKQLFAYHHWKSDFMYLDDNGDGLADRKFFSKPLARAYVMQEPTWILMENRDLKTEPNKALVPTPASVTPAADAPVAPDAGAAHL